MDKYRDIVLALAGVCQSAQIIHHLATNGNADDSSLKATLSTLLQTQPENTLAVFGGDIQNLRLGLSTLINQLSSPNNQHITRYWLSLLALEVKLNKKTDAKNELARRIARLSEQLDYYDLCNEQMLSIIAGIYVDIISPLGNRINVVGNPDYLQQPLIQHKIRSCLLAGIRCAVLWHQVRGSKWQILFFRRKLLMTAQHIYSTL
ncbi:high frequency lysogenization protein HflD [Rodentibacter caecimuris]|uniref:High frequency lysogenization protein HflD homolog n=1 Tax=Rodentibacter caecimuris TaxID=1796644 RepID=A0ABX3KZ93_9PAST|nr:lysogenization regulator HflD [Rodentibacter heylii]